MAKQKATCNNINTGLAGNATCYNCKHSRLLQYDSNPVIAECCAKPQPGDVLFPYERFVASTPACMGWCKYEGRVKYICVMKVL